MTNFPSYHLIEAGQGDPLVLLHGFTGSCAEWQPFIPTLAERYRVLAVDLPGHGLTQGPANWRYYQIPQILDELEHLLIDKELYSAHWLGYSMGGRLALLIGVQRPHLVRSILLESASPGLATVAERRLRREQDETLATRIESIGVSTFVDQWEKVPLFDSQRHLPIEAREALRARRLKNSASGLANSLRGMGTGIQPLLWADLEGMSVDTLLLAGELDQKFVSINERMANRIPRARLQIIPGAGHAIHLEQPDLFLDEVLHFLDRWQPNAEYLSNAEKQDKGEGSQRHLLEPWVQ